MKILFEHANILITEDDGFSEIKDGYLGVNGKRIDYIGKEKPKGSYDVIKDYTNKLLMPGLINTHCHAAMTMLRGLGSDLPLQEWLFEKMMPVEDRFTAESIRAASELALLEMISTGTTSFCDMYFINEATVLPCLESGIKANICRPMQSFDPADVYETMVRKLEADTLFSEYNGAGEGRILIDDSIHAEYTCSEAVVRAHAQTAKTRGTRMHIHLSETKREHEECISKYSKTPAQWFADLGIFDVPAYAAHCVWVSDEDIALMAEKGVSVMHNPSSNMKLGSGFAPIVKMQQAGINIALGTDGAASNNNLNMFEELHLASIIHKGYMQDSTVTKCTDTLRMATLNGAKLQGRPDTGALKAGNAADIIAIDLDKPHLFPNNDTVGLICYSAQGSDVCMTMVDGKILYENGEFLTMDREKVMFDARAAQKMLY
ncbi:MAG: amidohydrolase [Flexilinea sp.]|nr:amidohydrolase [Flexilinea sp.]